MPEQKIQTRFPELHKANGVKDDQLEILTPEEGGNQSGAAAQQQQQGSDGQQQNSGGEQNNGGAAAAAQQQGQQQAEPGKQPEKKPLDLKDMSDEDRNELLGQLTGGKFKSLDELIPAKQKTKEEIEKETAEVKQNALAWAFDSGKVEKAAYDSAIVLSSKTDRELALIAFTESAKADNPDITEEEAQELFKDVYHEGQKEDSLLYKTGQREMKKLAEAYRKDKVGVLDTIEPEYQQSQQVQQQYKGFKKLIKAVADQQPKNFEFSFDHPSLDGASTSTFKCSVPVDQKIIDKVISEITSERAFSVRNIEAEGKFDEKALANEFQYHLKARMFDEVINKALVDNTKEVEKHLMVQLGNKRQENGGLNNGQQVQPGATGQKTNTYAGLNEFHKRGEKFRSAQTR